MDPETWASCLCPLCGSYRTRKERILRVGAILGSKLSQRRSSCDATVRTIRAKRDAQSASLIREIAELQNNYDLEARAIDAAMHEEVARLLETSVTVRLVVSRAECGAVDSCTDDPNFHDITDREGPMGPTCLTGPSGPSAVRDGRDSALTN
jgi:hypothetical protein